MRTTRSACSSMIPRASPRCSCQMPKLDAGPPTFVFTVPPEPRPGLNRRPSSPPGNCSPKRRSWLSEQALNRMPAWKSRRKSAGNSCVLSETWSAGTPARMARSHSCPELASMCSPQPARMRMSAAFGLAFIAYRTVRPKAFGNARASRARAFSAALVINIGGRAELARAASACSGVRNLRVSMERMRRRRCASEAGDAKEICANPAERFSACPAF